jgi:hypothetical protein
MDVVAAGSSDDGSIEKTTEDHNGRLVVGNVTGWLPLTMGQSWEYRRVNCMDNGKGHKRM